MDHHKAGPAWWWYVVAGVLGATSIIVGVLTLVSTVFQALGRVDDFPRVPVPGTTEVSLDRAGSYTIYYEAPGVSSFDDEPAETSVPSMRVTVRPGTGGDALPLRRYRGSFDYSVSGHEGVALFTFGAPAPGTYEVEVEADVARQTGELAIGTSLTRGLVGRALIVGLLCFLLFAGAVAIVAVTAVKRYQARRNRGLR
jgi:hypothetical protein